MTASARRVRKLRLQAPDEGLIRRGALLLEDALRVATLPVADGGRVVVVRRLSVGKISSRASSSTIALAIESRFRELAADAVYGLAPAAEHAEAVYFRDPVEPFVAMATRLAAGLDLTAWFWPLAVPGWQPSMSRDESFRHLLQRVTETEAGPVAAARMLDELVRRRAIDPPLSALRWQDGGGMLRTFGWPLRRRPFLLPAPTHVEEGHGLSEEWMAVLRRWVRFWSPEDVRSLWLAGVALVSRVPGRLLDPRLPLRAQGLIARALSKRHPTSQPAMADESMPDPSLGKTTAGSSKPRSGQARAGSVETDREASSAKRPGSPRRVDSGVLPVTAGKTRAREIEPAPGGWPTRTAYAGLFFLLPVLQRLGIQQALEARSDLIELGLSWRILHRAAQRLHAPLDDSVLLPLREDPFDTAAPCPFTVPAPWRAELCSDSTWRVHNLLGTKRRRLLVDGSGRLAVALWHGRAPPETRALARDIRVVRGRSIPAPGDLEILTDSWLTAARRWCRRFVRIGLHDLICRPGRILVTDTHLDVLLPHDAVDIRVRRAGLDVDPDWIPWLGRVVQFHYLGEEELRER